ncbi:MAG: hypothetical protein Q9226_000735 [Calogaya cf. arnoldii]
MDNVDVLIVGAAPAGQINHRIIDKRSTPLAAGQANAIKCVTMEMLHSLGVGDILERTACRVDERVFWNPDGHGNIKRHKVIPGIVTGIKFPREFALNQGIVESLLLHNVKKFRAKAVEYSKVPLSVKMIAEEDEYPVQVELQSTEASMSVELDVQTDHR